MTVKSEPYYWLVCDAPDCEIKSTEGSEYAAWGSVDGAIDEARDSDWRVTDDNRHYCADHGMNVCGECGAYDDTRYSGEREYLCVLCAAKQGIHQCSSCGMSGGMHDRTCPNAVIDV